MLTRCTKNKIRGAALEYFKDDILQYIDCKVALAKDKDNKKLQDDLEKMDDKLSLEGFFYAVASECLLEGVDNGFAALEEFRKQEGTENDAN